MRRVFAVYIFLFLFGLTFIHAQDLNRLRERDEMMGNNMFPDDNLENTDRDSTTHIDASTIPVELYMWTVGERLGEINPVPVDTVFHHFQNEILTDGMNGEYNFLGNLGSPRQSRIFFNRPVSSQFIFLDPYSAFLVRPHDFKFTNTKSPFTNLTYQKGGDKRNGEERFNAYFSVNANKKLGVGFNIDYWYGRGMYLNQSTSLFNGSLFGTYRAEKYQLHAIFSHNQIKMAENGGITDDGYITHPLDMPQNISKSTEIPTNLTEHWNTNQNSYFFLTHRYNLGFERETEGVNEKIIKEFVPVTSFIHTLNIQNNSRKYIAYKTPENYFENRFFRNDSVNDKTKNLSVKNTLAIALQEGFSKWAKAGLTAFVTHEFRNYTLPDTLINQPDIFEQTYNENVVSVGGEFSKRQGKTLHYDINGEIALLGEDIGQFSVNGKMDLNFRLWNDTVRLDGFAYIKNIHPAFHFRKYHSNYYWWENNNLSKEFRTRVGGQLTIDRWRTVLKAGVENIKNYTYFANADVPVIGENEEVTSYKANIRVAQESENIQIFSATLKQDFKVGIFHLDNEITYQKTSNEAVLPLPELNLYHNLYISVKMAKRVLSLELGADMRYFTRYNAPDYSPAIGQFTPQNQDRLVSIGGYPFINVYANLHLKRTRFYVMMSHVNQGSGDSNYFLAPHYPVNPRLFRFGLSWNFFD